MVCAAIVDTRFHTAATGTNSRFGSCSCCRTHANPCPRARPTGPCSGSRSNRPCACSGFNAGARCDG